MANGDVERETGTRKPKRVEVVQARVAAVAKPAAYDKESGALTLNPGVALLRALARKTTKARTPLAKLRQE